MAIFVPAILESDSQIFNEKMSEILKIPGVDRVQVDFSDGIFTPTKTIKIDDIGILNPAYKWEAHLMVENPENYFLDTKIAGFNTVIIHFESIQTGNIQKICDDLKKMKISPALAISTETDPEVIIPYMHLFDQILILGVTAGKQGQAIITDMPERIKKLKKTQKNVIIEVDGGVKTSNCTELLEAGADMLVIGSALFENSEQRTPAQNYEAFQIHLRD